MTDPMPANGDIRFADGRWERYDTGLSQWVAISGPAIESIGAHVEYYPGERGVTYNYPPPRQRHE